MVWDVERRLIGLRKPADGKYEFFDPAYKIVGKAIETSFPGQQVFIESMSKTPSKVVLWVDSPTDGPAYAYLDIGARKANWLAPVYGGLTPDDIAPVRSIQFSAGDGFALSGYLTLPRNKPAKDLPLVVVPHPGPDLRDEPGFDWWVQAIASRGYAVLQVNYRGSVGLGRKVLEAGYGEWGRKMQSDLSDGINYLAAQGIVAPGRVCIVGSGYGAYAAMAGAAFQPGVYRCAVSMAGPLAVHQWVSARDVYVQKWALRYMGATAVSDRHLRDISPAEHADQIQAAIVLIHGKEDTAYAEGQTPLMAAALSRAGKPYQLELPVGGDHWLLRRESRLKVIKLVTEFLEKNNPPR